MKDSIFTKIIRGEIPCHKVYEDGRTIAFLDITPAQPGHILVVPKKQVEFIWDLDEEDYVALHKAARKIAQVLRDKSEKAYVGEIVEGLGVPHTHIHLIPFNTPDELDKAFHKDTGEPDHTALARMAETLRMEDEV